MLREVVAGAPVDSKITVYLLIGVHEAERAVGRDVAGVGELGEVLPEHLNRSM